MATSLGLAPVLSVGLGDDVIVAALQSAMEFLVQRPYELETCAMTFTLEPKAQVGHHYCQYYGDDNASRYESKHQ